MNESNIVESVALAEGDINNIIDTMMSPYSQNSPERVVSVDLADIRIASQGSTTVVQGTTPIDTESEGLVPLEDVEEPEPEVEEEEQEEIDAGQPTIPVEAIETHVEQQQAPQDNFTPIPENSNSYLYRENLTRFSAAVWFQNMREADVIIAGIGGIGSWTALLISRLGVRSLTIYDDDRVERVNMAGQFFQSSNTGGYKVNAMRNLCESFSSYYGVSAIRKKYTSVSLRNKIMICGFDNMASRRTFFNNWKTGVRSAENPDEYLFIDGRLLMEELQIYCIQGNDEYNMNRYETEFLFSDEEAVEPMCSQKQTSFMANMIAGLIVNLLVNFVANKQQDMLYPRDLPFMTVYYGDRMFFKTEA